MSIYVFLRLFMSKRVEKPYSQTINRKTSPLKPAFACEDYAVFYV